MDIVPSDRQLPVQQPSSSLTAPEASSRVVVEQSDHPLSASRAANNTCFSPDNVVPQARSSLTDRADHTSSQSNSQPTPNLQNTDSASEARNVRRNMMLAAWNGFTILNKWRRWVLVLRMLIGLGQLVAGLVILSLPSSLGASVSTPDTCKPEGMFVFLTLHIARVFCSLPIDIYLGLSPHQTPRSRREGAEGLTTRERQRAIGSLALDRRMGCFSDWLGLCHAVLFIVGNYVVWTSTECSHEPADSRPLWIICVCMLAITYSIIIEVIVMVLLLVFFLPLLITILHALGLANRLPQAAIHPETRKISQAIIDEQTQLVQFTLAPSEDATTADKIDHDSPLPSSESATNSQSMSARERTGSEPLQRASPLEVTATEGSTIPEAGVLQTSTTETQPARRRRWGLLLGYSRRENDVAGNKVVAKKQAPEGRSNLASSGESGKPKKYPLHPLPAHRATCPICLCDFEEVREEGNASAAGASPEDESAGTSSTEKEPLRLLKCGHVMHMSCVDQWLTTVSGRCPVCQVPLVGSNETDGASRDSLNDEST